MNRSIETASDGDLPEGVGSGSPGLQAAAFDSSGSAPSGASSSASEPPDVSRETVVGSAQSAGSQEAIEAFLGAALPAVEHFAVLLAGQGVHRGLIGPREVDRLWDRHLLNSAAVAAFLPASGRVIDVGSGAGLPGVVLAAMRPDLQVVLLEPMERRVTWLQLVVQELSLSNAVVLRGRAEELHGQMSAEVVTARAVAALDKLAVWCLPLVADGGSLLAMKGQRAAEELAGAHKALRRLGGSAGEVLQAPTVEGVDATTVVRVVVHTRG